jgi:anti-anti-sigma factor
VKLEAAQRPRDRRRVEHAAMHRLVVASRVAGGAQLIVVRGVVDRDAAREIDLLIRHGTSDPPAGVVIDISHVDEVNGALIGALLRASRRLAWRNRRLTIVCEHADLRRRLEIAGLDELADVIARLAPS